MDSELGAWLCCLDWAVRACATLTPGPLVLPMWEYSDPSGAESWSSVTTTGPSSHRPGCLKRKRTSLSVAAEDTPWGERSRLLEPGACPYGVAGGKFVCFGDGAQVSLMGSSQQPAARGEAGSLILGGHFQ